MSEDDNDIERTWLQWVTMMMMMMSVLEYSEYSSAGKVSNAKATNQGAGISYDDDATDADDDDADADADDDDAHWGETAADSHLRVAGT